MPRTSLLESKTSSSAEPELAEGATDVIEAATAEAAIAEVHERLGPDARILDARRELRGGVGGFFAKEVVQLHAAAGDGGSPVSDDAPLRAAPPREPRPTTPSDGSSPASSATTPAHPGPSATSPIDRLIDDAPDTVDFATFLRDRMEHDPDLAEAATATSAADRIAPAAPEASTAPGAPTAPGVPAAVEVPGADEPDPAPARPELSFAQEQAVATWRAAAGVPATAPSAAPDSAVPEEMATTSASPQPAQDEASIPAPIAGPAWSAARLLQLGIPADLIRATGLDETADDLAWTTALATALAPVCAELPAGPGLLVGPRADRLSGDVEGPAARSQVWFDALRDGRWLHLVVGGDGWRDHLASAPRAVSWTRSGDLPDALRCAIELGLTLGYGPIGGRVRRARPLDVALAVRELVDAA